MLAIGVAAFFAVPVAFLACATYAVLQLPKRMRKGQSQHGGPSSLEWGLDPTDSRYEAERTDKDNR
eukprot:2034556-Amphidinium_carterae.1